MFQSCVETISMITRHLQWALVPFLFCATLACAQSPTKAVKDFGLLGTWADNCNENASPANQYAIFSVTSRGTIQLRNDFGPDYDDMVYRIVDARRIGGLRISLRQLLTSDDQIALDTVMLKMQNQLRVWSSRGADGSTFVQDGLIPAASDRETGWMSRCDVRWTDNESSLASAPPRPRKSLAGNYAAVESGRRKGSKRCGLGNSST
jgi:hypothetical protein